MSKKLTGIFLDTGKISEIEKYFSMGIIKGVTTNPTIMVKDGVTGGWRGIERRSKDIAKFIDPLPLSVEVTSNNPESNTRLICSPFCEETRGRHGTCRPCDMAIRV